MEKIRLNPIKKNQRRQPIYSDVLSPFLEIAIEQKFLPSEYKSLISNNTDYSRWGDVYSRLKKNGYVFSKKGINQNIILRLPHSIVNRGEMQKMYHSKETYSLLIKLFHLLPHMRNVLLQIGSGRGSIEVGVALHSAIVYSIMENGFGFNASENAFINKNLAYIFQSTENYDNFLGVCLGGKRCKARKKLRQENRQDKKENRIERRNILTEKKRAKKDSMVLDNQSSESTNVLLSQFAQPQEQVQSIQSVQSREMQVEQQNALPPNPQKEDNTLLWVGGGLGTLIVLGLIIFLVLKK